MYFEPYSTKPQSIYIYFLSLYYGQKPRSKPTFLHNFHWIEFTLSLSNGVQSKVANPNLSYLYITPNYFSVATYYLQKHNHPFILCPTTTKIEKRTNQYIQTKLSFRIILHAPYHTCVCAIPFGCYL